MKKLLAILLVALIIFTGCDTTDVSSEISSEMDEPILEISPEDLVLAEKAAVDFGILHNVETWDNAEEIPPHMFVRWYLDYVNTITTYEERSERYTHENYDSGWVYPQEELEAYVQKYFDVSIEHLRSDEYSYHVEDGVYNLEYIGGASLRYEVKLAEEPITIDGDIMYIPMELSFTGEAHDVSRTLVIRKTEEGFKYLKVID